MGEELEWSEASTHFDELRNERKEVVFNLDGKELKFKVKALTQLEADKREDKAIEVKTKRNGEQVTNINSSKLKDLTIKYGVVEGPKGFNPDSKEHRGQIPPDIYNELADKIQNFSELDKEVRIGFRESSAEDGARA